MQMIRDTSVLQAGSDDDVWDRLHHLAPTSPPVRTGLFSANGHGQTQGPLGRHSPVANGGAALLWEAFPDAVARQAQPAPTWPRRRALRPAADKLPFDLLRTRLLQVLRANDLTSVAVTAPSPGCGATYTATNLALSLARLPACRTLLVDLNFRAPGVADALRLVPHGSLHDGLLGKVPLTGCLSRLRTNMLVGLAGTADPAPAELLLDPRTGATLSALKERLRPDVIIFDLPPMLAYDDVTALLPLVDGVLLVTDGTRTVGGQIARCQEILADQTQLLGVALNRARVAPDQKLRYGDG